MPAAYAHYRFGVQVINHLPSPTRQLLLRYRRMFDIGLQGPDFLFYHNPGLPGSLACLGSKFHRLSGQAFFGDALHTLHEHPDKAAEAYLYGALAHFILDAHCHPYVSQCVRQGLAGHVAIESEFDRFLLQRDGMTQSHRRSLTSRIPIERMHAELIAGFYPPISTSQVLYAVKSMGRIQRILYAENQKVYRPTLKLLGLEDYLIPASPDCRCAALDIPMLSHYMDALSQYPELLADLQNAKNTGTLTHPAFEKTFDIYFD